MCFEQRNILTKPKEKDFFSKVFGLVLQIPSGKVTSYGAIAKKLSMPGSARMVGYAMNASHKIEGIPAHRVVNRNGMLTGKHHFAQANLMEELLANEGVEVINDQIIDFQRHFWDDFVFDSE